MRKCDINRFNRKINKIDIKNPLSIGNGDFVMTLDATSTQSFYSLYDYIPLTSISNKLWFKKNIEGEIKKSEINGKKYMLDKSNQEELFNLKRQYPHKYSLYLVKILYKGEVIKPDLIQNINQELDLYLGIIKSNFIYDGHLVNVEACIYQDHDQYQLKINANSNFKIEIEFLYPSYIKCGYDVNKKPKINVVDEKLLIKYDEYNENILLFNSNSNYILADNSIIFDISNELNLSLSLDEIKEGILLDSFWDEDNSIIIADDILVERMILSKYLLKLNSTGIYPPSEAGLTYNNWYSKFHLEMHLIHSLWLIYNNHLDLLLKSIDYYLTIYESSKIRALENDYAGIRFPKMTSPDGLDSPSNIGPLLVWQEPHIPFMLQEIYRIYKRKDILIKYEPLIRGTIDFMISFLYDNGINIEMKEPLLECCESIKVDKCNNPMFEIEYFRHVFKHQGEIDIILYGEERYDYNDYCLRLIKPKISNNVYLKTYGMNDEFDIYPDHPTELFSYSYFISDEINEEIMKSTLDFCIKNLDFNTFWGWDFPLMGMTALNLDNRELGIKLANLDSKNNKYLYNGHNTSPREDLRIYLPGNGAFLLFYDLLTRGKR